MKLVHQEHTGIVPDIVATSCQNSLKLKDIEFRVPCGKCLSCQKKRRSDWSLRLEHEYLFSDSAKFITLTYNDWSVPRTKEGYPTLNKKHVQNYIKRLRNAHVSYVTKELKISVKKVKEVSKPLRYYAIGEYGSKTRRPHYHVLLFNMDIYNLAPLQNKWNYGFTDVGNVTSASINYVTKYMFKPFANKDKRVKPFSLMSKKPIIGSAYLEEYGQWHKKHESITTADGKGSIRRLPKAYLYRLFTKVEDDKVVKDSEKIQALTEASYLKHIDEKIKKFNDNLAKHYDGKMLSYINSINSDFSRQKSNINLKETI